LQIIDKKTVPSPPDPLPPAAGGL